MLQKKQVNKNKRKNQEVDVAVESTKGKNGGKTTSKGASLVAIAPPVCIHDKNHKYVTRGEKGYFTKNYYARRPDCTKNCSECGGEFGSKITISDKTPAYCCRNMFDKYNPCAHAYCHGCWMKHRFGKF